ncbi:MAG TPA: hypothetical protein VGO33_14840 [Gemmatimonadaceae bacterium]|jgi:hypothetical protein|nr:hypothetical protein [Gemmatimonadaceae bacterium]
MQHDDNDGGLMSREDRSLDIGRVLNRIEIDLEKKGSIIVVEPTHAEPITEIETTTPSESRPTAPEQTEAPATPKKD